MTKQQWRRQQLDKDRDKKEITVSCAINTRVRKISARPGKEWPSALRNIFENLEESIANDRRNASNGFSLLVALVDGRTCVSLALEIPVPNDGRPDREGRGYLVSFAQVRDMVEPLAHRVRLLIGISTTANRGLVRYRTPACLLSGRDSGYGRENFSSSFSSEANPLPAVAWDVAARGDCGPPKSNAATLAHFLVTSGTSLAHHQLTTK